MKEAKQSQIAAHPNNLIEVTVSSTLYASFSLKRHIPVGLYVLYIHNHKPAQPHGETRIIDLHSNPTIKSILKANKIDYKNWMKCVATVLVTGDIIHG